MKNSTATCPVMDVINGIKAGPLYSGGDDADNNESSVAIIGGVECVVDEIAFYVTSRQIALARFKLLRPDAATCKHKAAEMFANYPSDYVALYSRMIDQAMQKNYLYRQFVALVDMIGEMEKLIVAKVGQTNSTQVNVSLPELYLLPRVDRLIVYRPDILCMVMNKIAHYMNHINVNSLLRSPVSINLPEIAKFDHPALVNTVIPPIDCSKPIIEQMEATLGHEVEVAKYIKTMEKYHCDAISFINDVLTHCQKIINGLSAGK